MGLEGFLRELEDTLGSRVKTSSDVIRGYSRDWWPLAMLLEKLNMWNVKPKAVIEPESVEELSFIVRKANEHRVKLLVYSGGSSVTGASSPRGDCVVISLRRLNRVIDFNEEDLTVTVEAGILLHELEGWLNDRGYTLRYVPQSFHIATIGGSIATLGSGQHSTGYGSIEDIVLNMEVVLPTGEVVWIRRFNTPRSSLGPNMKHLFLGSEGAFGIVSKATLRILPKPPYIVNAAFQVPDFTSGLRIVRRLVVERVTPVIARLSDDVESSLRFNSTKPVLLLSYEGYHWDLVESQWRKARSIVEEMGGVYVGEEPFNTWLKSRFNYEEEIRLIDSMGLWFETLDLATTWSKLPLLYETIRRSLEELPEKPIVMAHASHFYINGAALYYTILYEKNPNTYWKIVETVFEKALNIGATISHHHGVGLLKSRWLVEELGPVAIILERVKRALDPNNVLESSIGSRIA